MSDGPDPISKLMHMADLDCRGLMRDDDPLEFMPQGKEYFPRHYDPCPSCSYKAQNHVLKEELEKYNLAANDFVEMREILIELIYCLPPLEADPSGIDYSYKNFVYCQVCGRETSPNDIDINNIPHDKYCAYVAAAKFMKLH